MKNTEQPTMAGDNMQKYYTGVGSRETPLEMMRLEVEIAGKMLRLGYTGRSGAADGSDNAFYVGYQNAMGNDGFVNYLPYSKFNGYCHNGKEFVYPGHFANYSEAQQIASTVHPLGKKLLTHASLSFHARNVYQVLGDDLNTPSEICFLWAPVKLSLLYAVEGGTNTALQLCIRNNIPSINLNIPLQLDAVKKWLNGEVDLDFLKIMGSQNK